MSEPFARALYRMTATDAIGRLQFGTLELNLDDAPAAAQWLWIADLIQSDWGLTSRLQSDLNNEEQRELGRIATMCRASVNQPLSRQTWQTAYDALAAMTGQSRSCAVSLAIACVLDIAVECTDNSEPDFTAAVTLAFETLTAASRPDTARARRWLLQLTTEFAVRTVHEQSTIDDAFPMSG